MVELILTPDPRSLLPPLLACLPTAFVSPRPPPALLPLLSPILRQRVQIFTSDSLGPTDSWLRLLCWDARKAERLQEVVDGASFEPHPVSGEIELPDEMPVSYRRVDEETLHARILVSDYSLTAIYLWCPEDHAGGGPGWRVAELLPGDGSAEDDGWAPSIGEADSLAKDRIMDDALREAEEHDKKASHDENDKDRDDDKDDDKDDDDDDDHEYWARYDATPGRTPDINSPAPKPSSSVPKSSTADDSYFSQYSDVQPAMDNDDPAEEYSGFGTSSLTGNMWASILQPPVDGPEPARTNGYPTSDSMDKEKAMKLNHPRPASTTSSNSDAVGKLEQQAENRSAYEIGVKQHIGSSIKGLFRLARCTGISRMEFQELVKTELELLNLSDRD